MRNANRLLASFLLVGALAASAAAQQTFLRGDANSDGIVSLADEITIQRHLFAGGVLTGCADAADTNDDGVVNIRDQVAILQILADPAVNGWDLVLPEPYPLAGSDPSADEIGCDTYNVTPASESEDDIVELGSVTAAPGEEVEIPIFVTNTVDVDAIQLVIQYDPDVLAPVVGRQAVELGGFYEQFAGDSRFNPLRMVAAHPEDGVFTATIAGTFALPGYELPPGAETLVGTIRATVSPGVSAGTVIAVTGATGPVGPHGMRNEITSHGEARFVSVIPRVVSAEIRIELPTFKRGDANGDGEHNISDAMATLNALFLDGPPLRCPDAGDTNDDGQLDVSDAMASLNTLFGTGPFTSGLGVCTPDETEDELATCESSACSEN